MLGCSIACARSPSAAVESACLAVEARAPPLPLFAGAAACNSPSLFAVDGYIDRCRCSSDSSAKWLAPEASGTQVVLSSSQWWFLVLSMPCQVSV
jgi:hypothetical protein